MEYKYARRMSEIKASEIRELLKLTEKPEVISFAGGLPAPELFPIEEIWPSITMSWTAAVNRRFNTPQRKAGSRCANGSQNA